MARPPAATRYTTRDQFGQSRLLGIDVGTVDERRIRTIARWMCLTPLLLAAAEAPPRHVWHRDYGATTDSREQLVHAAAGVGRRLNKLSRLETTASTGPLVSSVFDAASRSSTFYVTREGAVQADIPWSRWSAPSAHILKHARLVAEVGIHIDDICGRHPDLCVYSQRELDRGVDVYGDVLPQKFRSKPLYAKFPERHFVPDTVLSRRGSGRYIAVEAERVLSRKLDEYEAKLDAYSMNPDVESVWYVCETDRTAARVKAAGARVHGLKLRILLARAVVPGLREIDFLENRFQSGVQAINDDVARLLES